MNKTYTDKYLIKDISNKGFRLKYGAKGKSKKKGQKPKKYCKSKKERREWWRNLTPEQQAAQIEKWQAKKAERRENEPERVLKYNPKYPWMTEGVNADNRDKWLAMIHKKNPWLKVA